MNHNQRLGRYGEDLAVRCLQDSGLHLIERNWRCARGEIDIVAREADTLVFCEVKTRSSNAYGTPAEAVDSVKAGRLRGLGSQWLADRAGHWPAIRFDVIAILLRTNGPAEIHHLRGAL